MNKLPDKSINKFLICSNCHFPNTRRKKEGTNIYFCFICSQKFNDVPTEEENKKIKNFLLSKKRKSEEKINNNEITNYLNKFDEDIENAFLFFDLKSPIKEEIFQKMYFLKSSGLLEAKNENEYKIILPFVINYVLYKNKRKLILMKNLCSYFKVENKDIYSKACFIHFYIIERNGFKEILDDLYLEINKVSQKISNLIDLKKIQKLYIIIQLFHLRDCQNFDNILNKYGLNIIAGGFILLYTKLKMSNTNNNDKNIIKEIAKCCGINTENKIIEIYNYLIYNKSILEEINFM